MNINPKNRYKKVENGNYVIDIAKVSPSVGLISRSVGLSVGRSVIRSFPAAVRWSFNQVFVRRF